MNKITFLVAALLIAFASCTINVEDIQSLYAEPVSASHNARILHDPKRNRIILTQLNSVQFIDTKTKKVSPFALSQFKSLYGEFIDAEGLYYVFGTKANPQDTGLTLLSIDGSGKIVEKSLKNLNTFGCVLYSSGSTVFLTTKQSGIPILASYDYKSDNITGGVALIEDYNDNDCISMDNYGFFLTDSYLIAADMSNVKVIKHSDTKIIDTPAGYNRMAIDHANRKIYVTYSLSTNVVQYDIDSMKYGYFKGDPDQYAGFLGLATHPSDGNVYFFTSALKRSTVPSTTIIQTNYKLETINSFNIPNNIYFFRRGLFDTWNRRMYVLGYQTDAGHLNVYSVGSDRWSRLSTAAIIGIAVGGGAGLLALLAGIGCCIAYSRRQKTARYGEKSSLLGTTYISSA